MGLDIRLAATTVDAGAEMAAPSMAAPEGAAMAVAEGHAVTAQLGRAVADIHATDDAPRAVSPREQASRHFSMAGSFDSVQLTCQMLDPVRAKFLH